MATRIFHADSSRYHRSFTISMFLPDKPLSSLALSFLLLLNLQQQRTVDMRQHTSESDGCTNQGVQLFITANGKLQMARSNTLDFKVLGGVTGKLENFGCQVFENGGDIDSS